MSSPQNQTFTETDIAAINAARLIPIQVVQDKGHGHAGTAAALAPLSYVLFQRILRHSPAHPEWLGRDRFVLSAGHASLLFYTQNYLSGYGLTLADIAAARSFHSRTPGHPEIEMTPGVEMSTGPLGQGVASAVGMAMAASRKRALLPSSGDLYDHTVWVLAGDGCLQEGVSAEASSLAGTLGLDNLVLIWDDNNITIDSTNAETFSEDVRARYRSYGWRVLEIDDANDLENLETTLTKARERTGAPTLVALKSIIGYPSKAVGGTSAAHAGAFGEEDLAHIKRTLGFDPAATLLDLVPKDVLLHTRQALERGRAAEESWTKQHAIWASRNPHEAELANHLEAPGASVGAWQELLRPLLGDLPPEGTPIATRKTNNTVIRALHNTPGAPSGSVIWGGSADLAGSTSVAIEGKAYGRTFPQGNFIRYGIREHAMAAIMNGIALHSPWRAYGSTYLVFSDYLRPALRLSALMRLPHIFVFSHDSVAVGEDGPTHQPVEQLASLRALPGLDVVRPADARETIAAWHRIAATSNHPTALVVSRQDLPVLPEPPDIIAEVSRGGYIVWQSGSGLDLALIATGSEVSVALEAARTLTAEGHDVRVISMPCTQWFDEQPVEYRDSVLPRSLAARVTVEAGSTDGWWKYTGLSGSVIGIDRFGVSGSGAEVMSSLGITAENITNHARLLLSPQEKWSSQSKGQG
ncbi:transketolase [Lysinibacter sp. HNR]|uniref:transketolase n=1 Tax=Lysinibacter sp. HNR TaxID=3031408 RepID=UPI002435CF57|nr:transketolase [Lysinibacter sp. HNR]WGD36499.1 transketolase [Lysinibacter sp. HNR]